MAGRWHRPTVDTKFHIDMDWWEKNNRDIHVYIWEVLCEECRAGYEDYQVPAEVDWVDGETGEVSRVDGLWHCLRACCSLKADYISPATPVVDAVFRTFLANGNKPLSGNELYELLDRRPPATLLRILTGGSVYMGIRPVI
ncbi:MAG: hypothetical protein A2Y73_01530 [Chloroflexi bacterium RBG_13_56_8]|nr:MAG: hypothetical protein A2Y73_01530 [Chloroflexi bacterium RBG_13_56_8]